MVVASMYLLTCLVFLLHSYVGSTNHVGFVLAISQANQFYQMKGNSFSTMSDTLDFAALQAQSLSPRHPAFLVEVDHETFYFQLQGAIMIHFLRIESPEN